MDYFDVFSTAELLFTGAALAMFVVQVLYYRITYMRPWRVRAREGEGEGEDGLPPVSVVVYADNESSNLRANLPLLLNQDYPQYEVIVVNDGSTDESDEVLKLLENEYPHLYHTFIPQESKYLSRRKLSLTIGIKAAKNDILLFTEATCSPLTNQWLRSVARNYTADTAIVLGFCAYRTGNGFFHKLVSYDNLLSGVQCISAALIRRPYSGSGKNLSYRKSLFYEYKGYSHTLALHAGDDDLFVNEFAKGDNTKAEYTRDGIMSMSAYDNFAAWREMKVSRITTQSYFKGDRLMFYHAEKVSSALFLLSVIALIVAGALAGNPETVIAGCLLYFILYIIKALVWDKVATLLQQHSSFALLPFLEVAGLFVSLYIRVYRLFYRKSAYTFTIGK
ncbi:MAG: glycosyltransferase [Tannerellaceae bacterium]|jgi:glycosyltransferase involved in cell wall biosynthesis|nr:glycosyltransferase [Tannerellaceae bacterium]